MLSAIIPVLVVSAVFAVFAILRNRQASLLAGPETQYAHARAGAVAQRMGVTLLTGDPQFNFYTGSARRRSMCSPSCRRV